MRLIKQSFIIKEQNPGIDGLKEHYEWSGSVKGHCTVYMSSNKDLTKYDKNNTSESNPVYPSDPNIPNIFCTPTYYITTVYGSNICEEYSSNICDCTEYHNKRITLEFTIDESLCTRLLSSINNKFTSTIRNIEPYDGSHCTFIIPKYAKIREGLFDDALGYDYIWNPVDGGDELRCNDSEASFMSSINKGEQNYVSLISSGVSHKDAKSVLPLSLMTKVIVTGFSDDWKEYTNNVIRDSIDNNLVDLIRAVESELIQREFI